MAILARDLSKGLLAPLYVRLLHKFYVNDLWLDVRLAAKKEAVDYVLEHMRAAAVLRDRYDLLQYALGKAPAEGLILEFGVAKGQSVRWLGKITPRTIHGFDSFEGLPSDWDGTAEGRGDFTTHGKLPKAPVNVQFHVGWFDKTLPAFLSTTQDKAALVHIDCDIYESTKYVFETLSGRIVPGTVIVFDEYFNYPAWKLHEFKAFQEFIAAEKRSYRYLGYSEEKGHVAVEIL